MRCAEADGIVGEVLNLGTGREHSISEVVELVLCGHRQGACRSRSPRSASGPREARSTAFARRSRRRATRLGWEAKVSFEDGLRRTIDWIAESLDSYRPEVYGV